MVGLDFLYSVGGNLKLVPLEWKFCNLQRICKCTHVPTEYSWINGEAVAEPLGSNQIKGDSQIFKCLENGVQIFRT